MTALLAVGGLYLALPRSLAVGPGWLLLAIVTVLIIPAMITHHRGHTAINVALGHLLAGIITLFMLWSLALLVMALPTHKEPPVALLHSAAALWLTNVLVFASWYWRLDAGGPHQRAKRLGHTAGAFLFPQMVAGEPHAREKNGTPWSPKDWRIINSRNWCDNVIASAGVISTRCTCDSKGAKDGFRISEAI